jgi:hypothetical protein
MEGTAQLRAPTDDPGEMIRAVERLAREAEWPGGIVRAEVTLESLGPGIARQLGLFDAQRQRRASLDLAVDRIQRRFGNRIKRVVVADEGAWLPGRRFTLRDY